MQSHSYVSGDHLRLLITTAIGLCVVPANQACWDNLHEPRHACLYQSIDYAPHAACMRTAYLPSALA